MAFENKDYRKSLLYSIIAENEVITFLDDANQNGELSAEKEVFVRGEKIRMRRVIKEEEDAERGVFLNELRKTLVVSRVDDDDSKDEVVVVREIEMEVERKETGKSKRRAQKSGRGDRDEDNDSENEVSLPEKAKQSGTYSISGVRTVTANLIHTYNSNGNGRDIDIPNLSKKEWRVKKINEMLQDHADNLSGKYEKKKKFDKKNNDKKNNNDEKEGTSHKNSDGKESGRKDYREERRKMERNFMDDYTKSQSMVILDQACLILNTGAKVRSHIKNMPPTQFKPTKAEKIELSRVEELLLYTATTHCVIVDPGSGIIISNHAIDSLNELSGFVSKRNSDQQIQQFLSTRGTYVQHTIHALT